MPPLQQLRPLEIICFFVSEKFYSFFGTHCSSVSSAPGRDNGCFLSQYPEDKIWMVVRKVQKTRTATSWRSSTGDVARGPTGSGWQWEWENTSETAMPFCLVSSWSLRNPKTTNRGISASPGWAVWDLIKDWSPDVLYNEGQLSTELATTVMTGLPWAPPSRGDSDCSNES